MSSAIEAGTEIGGYTVTGLIGQGGMGTVYLAEQVASGREVALKILPAELARNEEFRTRFLRESRYAGSHDHPHIVKFHDAGEAGGFLYLSMDYIRGMDLATLLALEGALDPRRALAILGPVAGALDALHATGLIHRDVKPGNVIVAGAEAGSEGELHPYLTDFGLSKNPTQDSRALTAAGDFVGTYHYTAPEQILAKAADHRVDVYSLGCLLFECLTEEAPFQGSDAEVLHAHIEEPPPKASDRRPDLPPALDDVIATALAKDPDDRYSTCSDLVEAAREAVRHAPAPVAGAAPKGEQPVGNLRLKVTEGNAQDADLEVEDELLIGRHAPVEGRLAEDPEISRRHARVSRTEGYWSIEDLGSRNGTLVNGHRIDHSEVLSVGDKVQVGSTTLVVQHSAPPEDAATEARQAQRAATPEAPPASPLPISLRIRVDGGSGEAGVRLDGGEEIRLVYEGARWRFKPGS